MNSEDLIRIDLFCLHHEIELNFISGLKEYGMIEIIVMEEKQYFPLEQLAEIEKIIRLHNDLQINLEGIDVIMNLLNQIDNYKNKLLIAQNKLDFFEK
jgi:hypothetical protein|nr:chaperone modulator CbpM [uncultured Flavobacterium sp.]